MTKECRGHQHSNRSDRQYWSHHHHHHHHHHHQLLPPSLVHWQSCQAVPQESALPSATPPTPHLYTNSLDRQKYRGQPHQQPLLTCTPTDVTGRSTGSTTPIPTPPPHLYTNRCDGQKYRVTNTNTNNPSSPVHQQSWWAEVQGRQHQHQQHQQPLLTCTPTVLMGRSTGSTTSTPTTPPHLYTNSLDGQKYSS